MPANLNYVMAVAPNTATLTVSSTGDCTVSAVYTHDQYKPDAPNTLYANAGYDVPSECLSTRVCVFPALIFDATDDGFASDAISDGDFDYTQTYVELDQGGVNESYLAFEFEPSLAADQAIYSAHILAKITTGEVNSKIPVGLNTVIPVDIASIDGNIGSNGSLQQRSRWLEIDVTSPLKMAIQNVSPGSLLSFIVVCRVAPVVAGSFARLDGVRGTVKPRLIIIQAG